MKKYITLENNIYEAHLIIDIDKINDETLPYNRKIGTGADKNLFVVGAKFYDTLKKFFPEVIKDREEKKTGRNSPKIKSYFQYTSLLNDIDFINKEIELHFPKESKIDFDSYFKKCKALSVKQKLNSSIFLESEIANAQNGIAFKNWDDNFKEIIKEILLPTSQLKVFLFKDAKNETCAFWEFKQEYISKSKTLLSSNVNEKLIQKIFYGAPGTGKSHKVKELVTGKEERTERVTFHPEYDYNSFVGGYKPTMDGKDIRYEFVPQAFSNIYVKAWNDLDNDYYLVIEEINRGNCAEIFGDIFQLLDRTNEYHITPSKELKEYLTTQFTGNTKIDGNKLILPPNLNILATMNTSDQSLFPMDSAFKRRWDWEYIPINYEDSENNKSSKFKVQLSETESFSWLSFIKSVNSVIKQNDNLGMDKCLGNYFIKPETEEIDIETFVNKAIFYLWNDVFKDEMEENNIFLNKTTYEDFFPIEPNGILKLKEILEILKIDITPVQ
jgi:hypothetical protein